MSQQKKKKTNPKIWKMYEIKESSLLRLRKECPRCGAGVFLAEHKDRQSCGRCGYTSFKSR